MSDLKAVLGPTNTGKTHYAVERMLGHASGMIGLPLRLLAREIYDRIVSAKGERSVALITGEERIWPKKARYFVCTVEAMPMQVEVDCLVVDEVQLATDPDRGHVFTDRILRARGRSETLLLGADTMRPLLHNLGLGCSFDTRERFSELHYAGPMKITKLPKRTAIVAFSADEVYAIGELLRRQKGGAAIVMGALSPRTRNAQVDLYQSGEVDYLVATDAIGMGLNLDVDHIAFAGAAKFDGRQRRALFPAEMAQIAGRAGRFRNHGTFGETGETRPFEDELVRRIEEHNFRPVERIEWRNSQLDYQSVEALCNSLARPSGNIVLKQNPDALDEWVLRRIALEPGVTAEADRPARVRRLWDLCRLPDFRKAGHDGHFRLVQSLHEHLADPDARLSNRAMENRMDRLSTTLGDIPALQQRLAAIRTWTYAANRDDWLENPALWREKTRQVEDELSDKLHEALAARFVDRRTTALLAGLNEDRILTSELSDTGEIKVEGHVVGRLNGLVFEPASKDKTLEGKAVRSAAVAALKPILEDKLSRIATAEDLAFSLSEQGAITYSGTAIARAVKGADWLSPAIELMGGEPAGPDILARAGERLTQWLSDHIARLLPTHVKLKGGDGDDTLSGYAKGLAFRVMESGAAIDLREDEPGLRVEAEQREVLKALGLRAGRVAAYAPDAQKPAAQRLIATLRTIFDGDQCEAAPSGAGSFALEQTWSNAALHANGYLRFGGRAVRADLAERLAWEVSKRRREADKPAFELPPEIASIVSCPGADLPVILKGLGLSPAEKDPETGTVTLWRYKSRARSQPPRRPRPGSATKKQARPSQQGTKPKRQNQNRGPRRPAVDPDSPFAALASLIPDQAPPRKKRHKTKPKPHEAPKEAANADAAADPAAEVPAEAQNGDTSST